MKYERASKRGYRLLVSEEIRCQLGLNDRVSTSLYNPLEAVRDFADSSSYMIASNKKSRKNGKSSDNDQDSQDDEEDEGASSQDGADSDAELTSDEDAEDDDEFEAPKKSTAGGKKRKSVANGAGAGGKRGRTTKGSSPVAKGKKASQPRKARAKKTAPGGDGDDFDEAAGAEKKTTSGKDFPIDDDNGLFSTSPNQSYIETVGNEQVLIGKLVWILHRCCQIAKYRSTDHG